MQIACERTLSRVGLVAITLEIIGSGFEAEFQQFRDLGVDGIFTDFPDVAFRVLRAPLATCTRK